MGGFANTPVGEVWPNLPWSAIASIGPRGQTRAIGTFAPSARPRRKPGPLRAYGSPFNPSAPTSSPPVPPPPGCPGLAGSGVSSVSAVADQRG
ncbi:hypothetical protein BZL29_6211 [Mycobacterium kansasii]|uniref:Uncharacterized protein n=1 Tax=Mycobacterium kansasii TaxID=1768 RepID=A0A1V3WSJ4_MYCKA|nr:hypothetical protein BZL29_6211 [Mycobacterium kansasii]